MSFIFIVILIFLLLYYSRTIRFLWKFYKLEIPGPDRCYPLIGHALWVIGLNEEERYKAILDFGSKFDSIAKFWLGPIPIIGVVHPNMLQKIFSMEQFMEKTPYFYKTFGVDKSMISTSYDEWRPIRKIFNHSFNPSILQSCIPTFVESCGRLTTTLSEYLDGTSIDLLQHISICTLDMLMESTFGIEKSQEKKDEVYGNIVKAIEEIHSGISARFNNPFIRPLKMYKLTNIYKLEMAGREYAFGYQKNLYNIRKQTLLEQQQNFPKHSEVDQNFNKHSRKLIDNLILNEHQFSEETIRDNINQFLLAGFETTANQVCHVILMVAMHPEYQEQAYQEIKEVFHSDNVEVNIEILYKLRYLEQIIKETMRIFSVAPFICKTTLIDLELGGHVIPAGTTIFIPIHLVHKKKEIWGQNADKFDPEHFSKENVEKRHPYAYLPFSLGKRNCVGYKYALMSMKVILIKLLLKYKLSTDLKFDELKFCSKISLKLCTSYGIKLTER